jgi:drug/metabolite transporter (DMT)-like permease
MYKNTSRGRAAPFGFKLPAFLKNKKLTAVFIVFFCTILNTLAQFFLKSASSKFALDLSLFLNYSLFLGGFFYVASLIFYLYALKFWELSSLSPLFSLQYVFVTLISVYLFHEAVSSGQIEGLSFILIGVFFIAREARK